MKNSEDLPEPLVAAVLADAMTELCRPFSVWACVHNGESFRWVTSGEPWHRVQQSGNVELHYPRWTLVAWNPERGLYRAGNGERVQEGDWIRLERHA